MEWIREAKLHCKKNSVVFTKHFWQLRLPEKFGKKYRKTVNTFTAKNGQFYGIKLIVNLLTVFFP